MNDEQFTALMNRIDGDTIVIVVMVGFIGIVIVWLYDRIETRIKSMEDKEK